MTISAPSLRIRLRTASAFEPNPESAIKATLRLGSVGVFIGVTVWDGVGVPVGTGVLVVDGPLVGVFVVVGVLDGVGVLDDVGVLVGVEVGPMIVAGRMETAPMAQWSLAPRLALTTTCELPPS